VEISALKGEAPHSTAGLSTHPQDHRCVMVVKSEKKKAQSKSKRAGLEFSVSRVNRNMRDAAGKLRVAAGGPIYLTAVIEYICVELLETAGKVTLSRKRKRIRGDDVSHAVRADLELNQLLSGAVLFAGDRVSGVSKAVQPKPKKAAIVETDA